MVSTHHFAQGVKKKACDNFLDSIWGTIEFFEKNNNKICNMGSVEVQKRTCPLFSGDPFNIFHNLFSGMIFTLGVVSYKMGVSDAMIAILGCVSQILATICWFVSPYFENPWLLYVGM